MAMIRRHWRAALIHLLIVSMAVGGLCYHLFSRTTASTAATNTPESIGQNAGLDAVTWARIQQLRDRICLTNADLASIGCSRNQADQVLNQLLSWYDQNKASWDQVEEQERSADCDLAEAYRKINVGPRDETLLARLPVLLNAQTAAQSQQQQLELSAATAVEALLSSSQQATWTTARSNATTPIRYRYASGLSPQQVQSLSFANYKQGQNKKDQNGSIPSEKSILSPLQQSSIAAAVIAREQNMVEVIGAEQEVLPVPPELLPPEVVERQESVPAKQ